MMKGTTSLFVLLSAFSVGALASELDPVVNQVPQGLVVKIAPDGKREVFKTNLSQGIVTDDKAAAESLDPAVKPENKIESVTPGSELDRVSSEDSWHWYWDHCGSSNNGYYHYGYSYGGSYYNYYPSYSYYSGGYQYNYYYTPVHYGYHNGYHYDDQWGYHYGGHYGWHTGHDHW